MECVILIGLPASGKSTFYRERFAATHELVSKDAMRHNRQPQRRQEQLIEASLAVGRSVVVDNTNPLVSERASIIAIARRHGAQVAGYFFPTEARDALRVGKLPRKAGLLFDAAGQSFSFSIGAESLSLMTLKLPEIEDAETPRVMTEERITMLRDLCKVMDALFDTFLKTRASSAWEGQTTAMRRWMQQVGKAVVAA